MITIGSREKDLMVKARKLGRKRYGTLLSKLACVLGCKDEEMAICTEMGNACEWLQNNNRKHADIYARHALKVEPGTSNDTMHVTYGTHSFYVHHSCPTLYNPNIPFVVWLESPRVWSVHQADVLGERITKSLEELANLILLADVYKRVWAEAKSVELGESEQRADTLEKVVKKLEDICRLK